MTEQAATIDIGQPAAVGGERDEVRAATVSWRMSWRGCMENPDGVRSAGFSRMS